MTLYQSSRGGLKVTQISDNQEVEASEGKNKFMPKSIGVDLSCAVPSLS